MQQLVSLPEQKAFGKAKRDTLPRYCQECEVRTLCHGECPKNRFVNTPDGEAGLNYLCVGYRHFFNHVRPYARRILDLLAQRQPAALLMDQLRTEEQAKWRHAGRNDPCPCGSGKKYKRCCGDK